MSTRTITPATLSSEMWNNVENTEGRSDSIWFRPGAFTNSTIRKPVFPFSNTDPETGEPQTHDMSPMLPHYFDTEVLERELGRLAYGATETKLVPISAVGGAGDNVHARTPITDEWLQVVIVPDAQPNTPLPSLEVRWLRGTSQQVIGRYRQSNTSLVANVDTSTS